MEDILKKIMMITSIEDLRRIRKLVQSKIDSYNKKGKKPKKPKHSSWSHDLALLLWISVRKNHPLVKEPDLSKWAEDIDKINRIDGQNQKLIEGLLSWSQKDDFWQDQIRSGHALRKHFEKIYVAAKKDYSKKNKGKIHTV